MKVLAVFALFVAVAFGALGVDVSDLVSVSAFQCLKNQGYTYAIVRCFRSTGSADPNCAQSVANAHSAGMSNVDIYVFPCPTCSAGGGAQINATLTYVQQHGVKYNTMWLDIEGPQYWKSTSSNTYFFNEMVAAAKQHGVNLGVYTSSSQWTPIMGSFTGGANFPLWYAHYDNVQSFSDFSPFGGWNTPSMKQYNGDQTACGVGIDMNYSPGGPSTVSSATSGGQTTTHSTSGGPATTGGHSSSGPATSGGHSTSGGSGPSNSGGKTSSSGGQTSGETSSGQSTGATGTTGQTTTSYSSGGGSSGSSGGGQFQLDNDSIYSSKNGGKRIPIKVDDLVTKDLYAQQPAKITKKAASLRKGYDLAELEERLEETQHFSVWEEKSSKKFL